ncbi:zinc-ribbon domain-containing protein [Anaerolineales bacterium HSG6]|nr:zinc-ribbon domain-containing protein [Anaerolineales bacterium HSG6]
MKIRFYIPLINYFVLTMLLVVLFGLSSAYAATPQIKNLEMKIWPEYDQPDTLIIYVGELSEETELPARLTFLLPNYVEDLHAIAYAQEGQLFRVPADEVDLKPDNQYLSLTFSVPSRTFQFEYYDSHILSKDGDQRELDYSFHAPMDTAQVNFEIQQPKQAANFLITPSAKQGLTGSDGFVYHQLEQTDMKQDDTFTINATYSRATNQPSVQASQPANNAPAPAVPAESVSPTVTTPTNQTNTMGYILIVGGLILLVGSGGYWYWSRQQPIGSGKGRRRSQQSAPSAGFCHQCGTSLHAGAKFCHNCGTPRRA